MTGKFEIMSEVREGLDNLEVTLRDGDRIWTKVVLTKLCEIGRGFRFHVCANKGKVDKANRDYGEWLYDVTWLKYDCNYRVIDVPLVAECEWGRLENIYDDFDKLLLARALGRLMIFDGNYTPGSERIAEELARRVRKFNGSRTEDAWLLAARERIGDGCRFRYFTVEMNAVIPFPPPSGS